MSKDKRAKEIEQLMAERDHWREMARKRSDENAELRREVERQAILLRSLTNGAFKEVYESIAAIQMERDRVLSDVNRLTGAIQNFLYTAQDTYQQSDARFNEMLAILNEVYENQTLPHLPAAILHATGIISNLKSEVIQNSTERALAKLGLSDTPVDQLDAYNHPGTWLTRALAYIDAASARDTCRSYLLEAYGLSHDYRLVADQILRECRVNGEPRMQTLQWLSDEWMKESLNPKPKKETLQEGLRLVQLEIQSGLTRQEFCMKYGHAERTMRNYQGWWDALERAAKKVPQAIKQDA